MARVDTLRVIGSPETNKVMAGELSRLAQRALGVRLPPPKKAGTGTVVYPFDAALADLAVHYQRTATRVLWDLYSSRATRLEPLYAEIVEDVAADGRGWLWDGATISVSVRNVAGFAAGERQIVGTVKNAILDGAARRGLRVTVDPERPAVSVMVRLSEEADEAADGPPGRGGDGPPGRRDDGPPGRGGELSISVDLAGASLSQRGWRADHGVAPLREHLAAVLLMLARYDVRHDVLVDPTCGSGTICIEGALMSKAAPLWKAPRRPASDRLPAFAGLAGSASPGPGGPARTGAGPGGPAAGGRAHPPLFADAAPVVIGNDIDLGALIAAKKNATAAGVGNGPGGVVWRRGDFADLTPAVVRDLAEESAAALGRAVPESGLLLANPPYGERLDEVDVRLLYGALGDTCRRFRGWRAAFLVGHRGFEEAFGAVVRRSPRIKKPLSNGGLRSYFYLYEL